MELNIFFTRSDYNKLFIHASDIGSSLVYSYEFINKREDECEDLIFCLFVT